MAQVLALPKGALLVGDYQIERVLGAGGFGITYLGRDLSLTRAIAIKEYFPADSALREGGCDVDFRSQGQQSEFNVGLERFIEEAQALAQFDHRNIARVYRYFRANNTAYMVLHYEEGLSFKAWCQQLERLPTQAELDSIVAPLLDALETLHAADFLHRDIAPDNIIIRPDGSPVLIDFGSARREIAARSQTLSAVIKPGYSPVEQYSAQTSQQGPWTDIYALGATLYQAVMRNRPDDAPSRLSGAWIAPARSATGTDYRPGFLAAIDRALALGVDDRPATVGTWRRDLLGGEPSGRLLPLHGPRAAAAATGKRASPANSAPTTGSGGRMNPAATRPVGPAEPRQSVGPARPAYQANHANPASAVGNAPASSAVPEDTAGQQPAAPRPAQTRKIETQTTPELVWRPKPKPAARTSIEPDGAPTGSDHGASETGQGLIDQLAARGGGDAAAPSETMTFDRPLTQSQGDAGSVHAANIAATEGAGDGAAHASAHGPARPVAGGQRYDTYGIPIPNGAATGKGTPIGEQGGVGGWIKSLGRRLGGAARDGGGAIAAAGAGAAAGVGAAGLRVREGVGTAGEDVGDWWGGIKERHAAARAQRESSRAAKRAAKIAARQAMLEQAATARGADQLPAKAAGAVRGQTRRIAPQPGDAGPVAQRAMDQRKAVGATARGPSSITRLFTRPFTRPFTRLVTQLVTRPAAHVGGRLARAFTDWQRPRVRPATVLAFGVRCAAIVGIMTAIVTAPTWLRDLESKTARLGEAPPPARVTTIGLDRTLTGHQAAVSNVVPLLSGAANTAANTLGFATGDARGAILVWRVEPRTTASGKPDIRYGFDVAQPVKLGTVAAPVTSMAAYRLSIATGSKTGTVQLWDAAGDRRMRTLTDGASPVSSLAFLGTPRRLAAAFRDGRGRLLNARRGRRRSMGKDSTGLTALTWSPLRKQLISGGGDGAVRLWRSRRARKVARTFYSHTADVTALAVSNDGRLLASGGKDQQLKLWDPAESSTNAMLGEHEGPVTAVALSPNTRLLATAGTDATIKLWDVAERRVIRELVGSTGAVRALAFIRGGDQLVSAGDDMRVRVWNTVVVGAVPVPATAAAVGGTGLRASRVERGRDYTLRTRVSQAPAVRDETPSPVITLRDLTAE